MVSELIETLWNVNDKTVPQISIQIKELIETLWNVNKKSLRINARDS